MKLFRLFLALMLLSLLLLAGCRQRIVTDELLADNFVNRESEQHATDEPTVPSTAPTEATEPSETNEPSAPAETEPLEPVLQPETVVQPGGGGAEPPRPLPSDPTNPTDPPAVDVLVTLDAGQGECAHDSILVSSGGVYGALPDAAWSGHDFAGWFTESGAAVTAQTSVLSVETHTLYARFTAKRANTLRFDANGGRIKSADAVRDVFPDEPIGALPTPLREGYDFDGWFTEAEGGIQRTETDSCAADATLYAHWTYNPFKYWSFVLQNTTQQVYTCQQRSVYIEFADNVTAAWSSLIAETGSYNVAANLEDTTVTDDWVRERNPEFLIKCADGDMGSLYASMAARFPGMRILVVPNAAVYGSETQVLFYRLSLAKLLYPEWYEETDLSVVSAELGVSGTIYGA